MSQHEDSPGSYWRYFDILKKEEKYETKRVEKEEK
jgi:hypothetical protein